MDTARLPEPAPTVTEHVAPRTHTEQWLADTWQSLLDLDTVSATDNFFDLGGNSLLGTQLAARVRDQLKTDLPPRELFANPVLHQLADQIDRTTTTTTTSTPILPVPRGEALVCTRQQEGLWFEHQLDPQSAVYHIPAALRLHGTLDHTALNRALHTLITRHEALRTRFVEHDGLPHQIIDPPPADQPVPVGQPTPGDQPTPAVEPITVVDISADAIDTWVDEQISHPFNLAAGPVFRTALGRLAPDDHVLVLVAHHIVADGWSVGILTTELTRLYAAETGLTTEAQLPDLPVQPADHAVWQRARLDDDEFTRRLDRWCTTLADLPTLDFPTDRPRPAHPTGAGAWTGRPLPHDLAAAAHRYARDNHVSFLAIHQAALLTVLHRYTGQTDLPIGSVFSGRTHTSVEPLVGYFANTVVLRTTTEGNPTFTELIHRCHNTVLDATALQDIPFSLIVDNLQPERIPGRNPLFQISLTLQPATTQNELTLGTLTANPIDTTTGNARFDIAIDIQETPDGHLTIAAEYSTELFDTDRINRLLDHYTTALANGLAQPDQPTEDIDILTDSERDHILYSLNPALSQDTDGQVAWGPSSQVGTA
ncbi:condensation domain-containing protein [Micromonospora profundi]|uniref:Condensation domain-containing protein n=1 Tax=Micromonospora profundi TaxID=1420889 RepID=A0AAJ6I111_9ACTN|nr:condensation domain-containing protein [Micromonospora profundi]WLS48759.1 condensation domain-containing protein [Micromonospora profundi]